MDLRQMLSQQAMQMQTRTMWQGKEARQQQHGVPMPNGPQPSPQQLAQLKIQMPMQYQQFLAEMQANQQQARFQQQQQQRMMQQHQATQQQAAFRRAQNQHAGAAQQIQMSRPREPTGPSPQPQPTPAPQSQTAPLLQTYMHDGVIHNGMMIKSHDFWNRLIPRQPAHLQQKANALLRQNSSRGGEFKGSTGTRRVFSDDSVNNALSTDHDYGHGILLNDHKNEEHNYGLPLNHNDGRGIIRHDTEERHYAAGAFDFWDEMRTGLSTVNKHDGMTLSDPAMSRSASRDSHTQPRRSVHHHPLPSMDRTAKNGHSAIPPKLSSRRRHKVQTPTKDSTVKMPTTPPPSLGPRNVSSSDIIQDEHVEWNPQNLSGIHGVSTGLHGKELEIKGIWTSYTISEDHTGGSEAISQLRLAALRSKDCSLIHFQETQRSDITPINAPSLDLYPRHDVHEYDSLKDPMLRPKDSWIDPQDIILKRDFKDDILENFDFGSFLHNWDDKESHIKPGSGRLDDDDVLRNSLFNIINSSIGTSNDEKFTTVFGSVVGC